MKFVYLSLILTTLSFGEPPEKVAKYGLVPVSKSGNTSINLGNQVILGDKEHDGNLEVIAARPDIQNTHVRGRRHFKDTTFLNVLRIK